MSYIHFKNECDHNASSQWNQIRGLLGGSRSENFFYFGHGAVDFIGVRSGNKITSSDLVSILTNNVQSGIQAIYVKGSVLVLTRTRPMTKPVSWRGN
jgi:hypothetical protein